MRQITRHLLRFALIVAVVAALPALVPWESDGGPYVSALADLTGGAAMAAPQCANKGCPIGSNGRCTHRPGAYNCAIVDGSCINYLCR